MRNHYFMLLTVTCIVSGGGLWLSKMMDWTKIFATTLI